MSAREFEEWRVFYSKFEPFGEFRDDLRASRIAADFYNLILQLTQKHPDLRKPTDWVLDLTPKTIKDLKIQSAAEMKEIFKALAAGAKEQKRGKAYYRPADD